ncbi:MAG: hypothetical protein ACE5EX_04640, partial [Phycisphaerae bacterium]
MAKTTTRTRGKKKLQDVIESIPEESESVVAEVNDDTGANADAHADADSDSKFVEAKKDKPKAGAKKRSGPRSPKKPDAAPPDDDAPIDAATHEKYERVKR